MDFSYLNPEKPPLLDITDWKETGEQLKKTIVDAVKDTQRILVRAYPDRIKMTSRQYADLTNQIQSVADPIDVKQEFFLYRTPHNVMEVEVEHEK